MSGRPAEALGAACLLLASVTCCAAPSEPAATAAPSEAAGLGPAPGAQRAEAPATTLAPPTTLPSPTTPTPAAAPAAAADAPPPRPLPAAVPADSGRALDGDLSRWVTASGQSEAEAAALGGWLSKRVCAAWLAGDAVGGEAFDGTAGGVSVALVAERSVLESGALFEAAALVPAASARVDGAEAARQLEALRASVGLVGVCEVHTHGVRRDPSAGALTITVGLTLVGTGAGGRRSEAHLELGLVSGLPLAEQPRVRGLTLLRGTVTVTRPGRAPMLEDVTGRLLTPEDAAFDELGFEDMHFASAFNLDFGGLAVVDVTGDGRLDIYVARSGRNRLLVQRPDGTFRDEARERGVDDPGNSRGVLFIDLDGDGLRDLLVANLATRRHDRASTYVAHAELAMGRALLDDAASPRKHHERPLTVYRALGDGTFRTLGPEALGGRTFVGPWAHLAAADVDLDGDLDVWVAGYGDMARRMPNHTVRADNGQPNLLLVNASSPGTVRLRDEASARGLDSAAWSYAAAFADADGDGDLDLAVANDWGPNALYRNDGAGHFEDVAAELGAAHPGAGMGVTWLDVDGDARLDLLVSQMHSNAGQRVLDAAAAWGDAAGLGAAVGRDLRAAALGNVLLRAEPDGTYTDATEPFGLRDGGWAWGAVAADLDLDGDEDLVQANGFVTGARADDW